MITVFADALRGQYDFTMDGRLLIVPFTKVNRNDSVRILVNKLYESMHDTDNPFINERHTTPSSWATFHRLRTLLDSLDDGRQAETRRPLTLTILEASILA